MKEEQQQQQLIVRIIDAVSDFINNPLFAKFGPLGLFVNGVFSTFIPFPPEVTAISLILAGISRTEILAILITSWIIGAAVGYYTGLSGKELVTIAGSRRKKREKIGEDNDDADRLFNNNNNSNQKFQYNDTNVDGNKKSNENKNSSSLSHRLLERYGWAIIFVSPWIPILGDIIPLIAGAKRYEIKKFMIAIAAGKIARAVAVIFFGSYLASLYGSLT